MQQLKTEVTVNIPPDYVVVEKAEYQELKSESLLGQFWSMKDLEQRTNKSSKWIKENILYQPRFRTKIDVKNGGFVYYPESQGQNWSFHAKQMAEFLDNNFHSIFDKED